MNTIKNKLTIATVIAVQFSLALPVQAATNIAITDLPLDVALNRVNSILVIDDSSSMDFELLLDQHDDAALYWDTSKGTYTKTGSNKTSYLFPTGAAPTVNTFYVGDKLSRGADEWSVPPVEKYVHYRNTENNPLYYNPKITYEPWKDAYLNGALRTFGNSDPTKARLHPWLDATSTNNVAAPSTNATTSVMDLTKTYYGSATTFTSCATLSTTTDYWTFRGMKGMVIPATVDGKQVCSRTWGTTGKYADWAGGTVGNTTLELIIPYNPATFWMKNASCTGSFPTCATAADGNKYQRFDINSMAGTSYTLPDGTVIPRDKAAELQNFANWFTYYRKRKLLMAASVGSAMDSLQNNYRQFSATTVLIHSIPSLSSSSPTFYDFTSATPANNGRGLIGKLYDFPTKGGTPTLDGIRAAGNIFNNWGGSLENHPINLNTTDGITNQTTAEASMRCSANNAFVITDGFVNQADSTKSFYGITYPNRTLYAEASSYFKNIRWWGSIDTVGGTGNVGNTMNTYGITLGTKGTKFGSLDASAVAAAYTDTIGYAGLVSLTKEQNWALDSNAWNSPYGTHTWPAAQNNAAEAIDDLWRAALYTKGTLLSATDSDSLDAAISEIVTSMFKSGSTTNASVSTPNVTSDDKMVVLSSYNSGDWTGELKAYNLDLATGDIVKTSELWSAKEKLTARTTPRVIATSLNGDGVPFTASALGSVLSTFAVGASDGADVINYLRGDRTKEGVVNGYRKRAHLLGDIVNSTPIFVSGAVVDYTDSGYQAFKTANKDRTKMVYVGANDGMLHAFEAATGEEVWAYVPGLVHSKLKGIAKPNYLHQFNVNGPLTSWDVKFADGSWHTILIGGLREGGSGYYAIDITEPKMLDTSGNTSQTKLAEKVLWEFNNTNMGLSFGKPYIAQLTDGTWVALFTSGYNNTDGKGHLFVVNVETGSLIKDLVITEAASGGLYDQVGLAQISALATDDALTSGKISWVYGGDLNGNIWRFDLTDSNKDNWSIKKLAANLRSNSGTVGQPITTAPELGYISTKNQDGTSTGNQIAADNKDKRLMVYTGNGILLHANDYSGRKGQNNGFYAIEDANDSLIINNGACANLACLAKVGLGQTTQSQGVNNWGTADNDTVASGVMEWWNTNYDTKAKNGSFSFTWDGKQRAGRGWYISFSEAMSERLIYDPVYINGVIVFTTMTEADTRFGGAGACEKAYSALYVLAANKGGAQDGYPSRRNLGFGIAAGITPFAIGSNTYGLTQRAGEGDTVDLPKSQNSAADAKKYGWREIAR